MSKNRIIQVQKIPVSISFGEKNDFICITDIATAKTGESRAADVIKNWLRSRLTLEFLGTWEAMYNENFKVVEFDHFKQEAGLHTFTLNVSEYQLNVLNEANKIGVEAREIITKNEI